MKQTIFAILTAAVISNALAADYPDPNRFAEQIAAFEEWDAKNTPPAKAVLFVGSSSIRMWKTAEAFSDMPVINRGFGGSWMIDSFHFADKLIIKYKPAVVVVYAGDNDIAGGLDPLELLGDFVLLQQKIRSFVPSVKIVCLSIKPSQSRWKLWPKMQQANRLLAEFADKDPAVTFVDMTAVLLNAEGMPDATLFKPDNLHLNEKGYAKWNEVLRPVLEKHMKE